MFYETEGNRHGLPHNPFTSCIVPRPIGWISTLSPDGVPNLAPYSFFNGVAGRPPIVMFATNGRQPHGAKDTAANCEATGEFVVNMASWELREAMSRTSAPAPAELDEMALAGLESEPARMVAPPRVKAAPIHLECVYLQTTELPTDDPEGRNAVIFGRVVGIHIRDEVLTDGLVDVRKIRPIGRLGYMEYTVVDEPFTMIFPDKVEALTERAG